MAAGPPTWASVAHDAALRRAFLDQLVVKRDVAAMAALAPQPTPAEQCRCIRMVHGVPWRFPAEAWTTTNFMLALRAIFEASAYDAETSSPASLKHQFWVEERQFWAVPPLYRPALLEFIAHQRDWILAPRLPAILEPQLNDADWECLRQALYRTRHWYSARHCHMPEGASVRLQRALLPQ